jgi:hypothetical protein
MLTCRALPSNDRRAYYDPVSSPSSSSSLSDDNPPSPLLVSNSGNKLHPSARMIRKGKMCAWSPAYEEHRTDQRVRHRLKLCMEQFMPEAAMEVGSSIPQNVVEMGVKRSERKRKRQEDEQYRLPHLASPSPPLSTAKLAPMMALPRTYVDIMISPAMRHSLSSDAVEQGLQRTASELLEGEKGLMQALGRLREVLRVRERDVPVVEGAAAHHHGDNAPNGNHSGTGGLDSSDTNGVNGQGSITPTQTDSTAQAGSQANGVSQKKILPLPHISDTDNLWRVTQELLQPQPQPTISFHPTEPGTAIVNSLRADQVPPEPTPVQALFTVSGGITIKSTPNSAHPGLRMPVTHPSHPKPIMYNLDMWNQTRAVDDALERISELLADCMEYKERLEEARNRVADVSRARKKVWSIVKERAARELDRESKV